MVIDWLFLQRKPLSVGVTELELGNSLGLMMRGQFVGMAEVLEIVCIYLNFVR